MWDDPYFLWLGSYSFSAWLYAFVISPRGAPDPAPLRSWIISRVVGTVGGAIGGSLASRSFGVPTPQPAISFLLVATGIAIGTTIAVDLYSVIASQLAAPRIASQSAKTA